MNKLEKLARLLCEFDGLDPDEFTGREDFHIYQDYEAQAHRMIAAGMTVLPVPRCTCFGPRKAIRPEEHDDSCPVVASGTWTGEKAE